MSIIENEYNNANFKEGKLPIFYSEIKVSLLDIISENEELLILRSNLCFH